MKVFLLGAGASKSYNISPTGVRMPLAKEVFATFEKLEISENPWVLIGNILNYARDTKGIDIENVFKTNYDIEEFHSEVEQDLLTAIESHKEENGLHPSIISAHNTYNQLVFFFASTINEIQNGPASPVHQKLSSIAEEEDVFITFNWDTLLDRALFESDEWHLSTGYGLTPLEIFCDGWKYPEHKKSKNILIKLHGSTNWITSFSAIDQDSKEWFLMQDAPNDTVRIFEHSTREYDCFAGRYMGGYQPFSMGYYPPNLLSDKGKSAKEGHVFVSARLKFPGMPEGGAGNKGVPTIPLIIPPVKDKKYKLYGTLFEGLWQQAEDSIANADAIYIIGYSFPRTDIRTIELFQKAFCRRTSYPLVTIINPSPESSLDVFKNSLGLQESCLKIRKGYFDESFEL
jgi:hypothetical protein